MHPVLFEVFGFPIATYGLFVAGGLLIGIFVAVIMARRHGVDENLILDLAFLGVVAGIVGARITFIIVEFPHFIETPLPYIFSRTGFVFAGGVIAGVGLCYWKLKSRGEPVWHVADVVAPAMPLGHAFGRIGCFFAGCCFGKTCNLPWGVRFPRIEDEGGQGIGNVFNVHRHYGLVDPDATQSLPVHPTQLYEAAALFVISAALFWMWRKRKFEGMIFFSYIVMYSVARFIIEFFRGDTERGVFSGLSTSQWISIGLLAVAAWLWVRNKNKPLAATQNIRPESDARSENKPPGQSR